MTDKPEIDDDPWQYAREEGLPRKLTIIIRRDLLESWHWKTIGANNPELIEKIKKMLQETDESENR